MKRSVAGSSRSKRSRFSWKDDSFSSSPTSQRELMDYLGLAKPKPKTMDLKLKECYVAIGNSKCKICKRVFKCKTDTKKHIEKKHEYLLRKKDNKLVRVVMRLKGEKFCDSQIDSKYLVAPALKSPEINKSARNDQDSCQKPLEVNNNASYKNDHVSKIGTSAHSTFAERVHLEKDEGRRVPSASDCRSGRFSPASSISDSETIVLVSDIEMDMDDQYIEIYPYNKNIKEENDIDDGEIVFVKEVSRNDFDSVRRRVEVAGDASVDSDIGIIMEANGRVKREPKVEPMETETNGRETVSQVPIVPSAPVPAGEPPNPGMMDLDDGGISDAETEILAEESNGTYDVADINAVDDEKAVNDDIASLLADLEDDDAPGVFDIQTEETCNFTVNACELGTRKTSNLALNNNKLPARKAVHTAKNNELPTGKSTVPELIIIDDDEPVIVDEPVSQPDLTKRLKHFLLTYAKETEAASRRTSCDANNNQGPSMDLPEDVTAKMSIMLNAPKIQSACQRALRELGIKMEDWV